MLQVSRRPIKRKCETILVFDEAGELRELSQSSQQASQEELECDSAEPERACTPQFDSEVAEYDDIWVAVKASADVIDYTDGEDSKGTDWFNCESDGDSKRVGEALSEKEKGEEKEEEKKEEEKEEEKEKEEKKEEKKEEEKEEGAQEEEEGEGDQDVYEVERIESIYQVNLSSVSKPSQIYCLVNWRGYSKEDNTWEPLSVCINSMALVKECFVRQKKLPKLENCEIVSVITWHPISLDLSIASKSGKKLCVVICPMFVI